MQVDSTALPLQLPDDRAEIAVLAVVIVLVQDVANLDPRGNRAAGTRCADGRQVPGDRRLVRALRTCGNLELLSARYPFMLADISTQRVMGNSFR